MAKDKTYKSARTKQLEVELEVSREEDGLRDWAREELKKYDSSQQKALYDELHEQWHGED